MFASAFNFWISLVPLLPVILGAPVPLSLSGTGDSDSEETTTPASSNKISSLLRPAQFSRVAYCSREAVTNWECGAPCKSLGSKIEVLSSGGDGGVVPMYYIVHDPTTESIVITHQGTESSNILSILNDVKFLPKQLNATRFPDAGEDVKVHDGFQDTFERTADGLLEGVKVALEDKGVNKVLVTGHSLGAAIATMDAIMLKQDLDPSIEVNAIVFGLPRGGNQAWADFVDSRLGDSLVYLTNQNDPVPKLPPSVLGFKSPAGEIHKASADEIIECPGQENEVCSVGNSPLKLSVGDHRGPYVEGVSFGSRNCPL